LKTKRKSRPRVFSQYFSLPVFLKFLNFPQDETGNTYKKPAFTVFKMKNTFISLDKAFEYVGDNSSFQKLTIKILAFQWIFYSFLTMGLPFLFTTPQFFCSKTINGKTVQTSCTEEDACSQFNNESSFQSDDQALSQQFNLYCQKKVILGFLGSLFFIGKKNYLQMPFFGRFFKKWGINETKISMWQKMSKSVNKTQNKFFFS